VKKKIIPRLQGTPNIYITSQSPQEYHLISCLEDEIKIIGIKTTEGYYGRINDGILDYLFPYWCWKNINGT
jgi:hypothetical protein